jgi:hypothetical protein
VNSCDQKLDQFNTLAWGCQAPIIILTGQGDHAIDVNAVIKHPAKMLERILEENIALELRLAPDLPPINADSGMIEQILVNLSVSRPTVIRCSRQPREWKRSSYGEKKRRLSSCS